eukprot:TRINITY_DN1572_c1_g1_i1.p1 TRINITY_DN1572_c1_g1~~TRINITY_DN1572_c1_g1_i1.p1  ORF type:complete len:358 (-),score=106.97 TRINITY_DN1572_c1_g1_i1:388-1461(-)
MLAMMSASWFLTFFGVLLLLKVSWSIFCFVWLHLLRPRTNLADYGAKNGAWALVTGCTDGIGKGFVQVLAQRGFNIIAVGRNADKLHALGEQLEKSTHVQTKLLVVNCANTSQEAFKSISDALEGLDLSIVINNVGINNTEIPDEYVNADGVQIDEMISVNCRFACQLTRRLLPLLKKRKRSAILNLSSISGVYSTPMMSLYSATKSFMNAFSRSLSREVSPFGIRCVSLVPYFVVSKMSGYHKANKFMVPSATDFACASLDKFEGAITLCPWIWHDLVSSALSFLPEFLLFNLLMRQMKSARKGLLSRREREAKKQQQQQQQHSNSNLTTDSPSLPSSSSSSSSSSFSSIDHPKTY